VVMLGALPDPEVAQRTGRSLGAVNKKREQLGRPALASGGGGSLRRFWTATEDKIVRTLPPQVAAGRTGRTVRAVHHRRSILGLTGRSPA
jgi:hypothetical protein